jgi:hypothetical protein
MADPKKTDKTEKTDDFLPDNIAAPESAVSLVAESAIYSSVLCVYDDPQTKQKESWPIQGYLIDARPMHSPKHGDFIGLVFQLTRKCAAPKEAGSKELVILQPGAELIVPAKEKLKELEQYVGYENVMELWLKPKGKITTGTGNTMEQWDVRKLGMRSVSEVVRTDKVIAELGPKREALAELPAASN